MSSEQHQKDLLQLKKGKKYNPKRRPTDGGGRTITIYPSAKRIANVLTTIYGGKGIGAAIRHIRNNLPAADTLDLREIPAGPQDAQDRELGKQQAQASLQTADLQFLRRVSKHNLTTNRSLTIQSLLRYAWHNLDGFVTPQGMTDDEWNKKIASAMIQVGEDHEIDNEFARKLVIEIVFRIPDYTEFTTIQKINPLTLLRQGVAAVQKRQNFAENSSNVVRHFCNNTTQTLEVE